MTILRAGAHLQVVSTWKEPRAHFLGQKATLMACAPRAGIRANTLEAPIKQLEKHIPTQKRMDTIFLLTAPSIPLSVHMEQVGYKRKESIDCKMNCTSVRTRESENIPKRPYLAMTIGVRENNSAQECVDWFENTPDEYAATAEEVMRFILHYPESLFQDDVDGILLLGSEVVNLAGYVYPWWPYLYISKNTGRLTLNAKHKMFGDMPGKWLAPGCKERLT